MKLVYKFRCSELLYHLLTTYLDHNNTVPCLQHLNANFSANANANISANFSGNKYQYLHILHQFKFF